MSVAAPARPPRWQVPAAFAAYLAIALAVFGRVLSDFSGSVVGAYGGDQSFFAWSLAWWPDAIRHGRDPLITNLIYAPHGFNLAWATVIPGPSLAAAPLTLTVGPIAAYNVLALLALPLDALAAFLLCRELSPRFGAALVGGYVYGFSSYGLAETVNHLNLALVFCPPLLALVAVRHARGGLSDRGAALRFAALFVAQLSISTEVLLTSVLACGFALAYAIALCGPPLRPRLVRTAAVLAAGGAGAGLVASPFLWVALAHRNPLQEGTGPLRYPTDLANVLVPTQVTALGSERFAERAARLVGNLTEQTAYVGVGFVLVAVAFAVVARRRLAGRLVTACALTAAVLMLGSRLTIEGRPRQHLPPWRLLEHVPFVDLALPARLPVYLWLCLAVATAQLLAVGRGSRALPACALTALGVALILPSRAEHLWRTPLPLPAFFRDGSLQRTIRPGEDVLVLPFSFRGPGMRWQFESDFRFRLVGGYAASLVPQFYWRYPIVPRFYDLGFPSPDDPAELQRFLTDTHTEVALIDPRAPGGWPALFRAIGAREALVGGVIVERLS